MESATDLTASVAAVRSLFGAAACSMALVDEAGDALTFVAADGEGATSIIGVHLPVGRGIAGWAVMSGQPIAVRDAESDIRFAREVAESTGYLPTSILAAPVPGGDGEPIGVLEVLDPTVETRADWALAVLGTLAGQLGALVVAQRRASGSDSEARLAELGRRVLELTDEQSR